MDKGKSKEFVVNLKDEIDEDPYTSGSFNHDSQTLIKKVLDGILGEEVCKLEFNCIDEAEAFHNMFAKVIGFSVRKDDLKQNKNGVIISRKWVCSREGHRLAKYLENENRQHHPQSLARISCPTIFRIAFSKKLEKWIVKEFKGDHNHPLVDAIDSQFLWSHRAISNLDKAHVNAMRKVSVKTSQIMDYMVQQSGGHEHVGFIPKDMYNHVDAMCRIEINDSDAKTDLVYLCGKAKTDPSFYYKFSVDEQSWLANLFWTDFTSQLDYACFGDVLAFDTTYRTNAYKKPPVMLAGVNHHHQTVVFGCALLVDESIATYEWVLETFLVAMMNKKPIFVIIDGDKAMSKTIKKVFPDVCHRLCAWHLQQNAFTNVHIKDFTANFARCMFMRGNPEDFECAWHEMVENLGLHGNRWVIEIYGK